MENSLLKDNITKRSNLVPITIIGALFFIFGFVTWLNGILIPYLKIACELNNFESYFVATAFYISYFFMALPSSFVLKRTGLKKGMMLGLFVMAAGALLFIPAALTRTYGLFLAGLFVMGTGLALLQTASNPYITILGPLESAAKRISIMGVCNKVAGIIAPLILAAVVLHDADSLVDHLNSLNAEDKQLKLNELASRVITPYLIMTAILIGLGLMVNYSPLPELDVNKVNSEGINNDPLESSKKSVLQFPNLVLGVFAIFFYVGVEVMAGDTIISYGLSQGFTLSVAKNFTSYTLIGMLVGYFIGIATIPRLMSQQAALRMSAILGVVFSMIAIFSTGYISVLFIALLGLANALMWPAIWPLAIAGLGKFTNTGSSLLIMGISGGALLPPLYGWLADKHGDRNAYWLMIPCYLFILYYAMYGHKKRS